MAYLALFACLCTAVFTAALCAKQSLTFELLTLRHKSLSQGITTLDQGWHAIAIPFLASAMLLLLFFTFGSISALIMMSVVGMATLGIAFLLYPVLSAIPGEVHRVMEKRVNLPTIGAVPASVVASAGVGLVVVLSWLLTGHWLLSDILGVSLCVVCSSMIRLRSLKFASALLLGLFLYDIFWVFFSVGVFGRNVMVDVATREAVNPLRQVSHVETLQLPMKLMFPTGEGRMLMLGLGDIALPSLLVSLAMRFDLHLAAQKSNVSASGTDDFAGVLGGMVYCGTALTGYTGGLILAFTASHVYHVAQPALLYIVPMMLLSISGVCYYHGDLWHIWIDVPPFYATGGIAPNQLSQKNMENPPVGRRTGEKDEDIIEEVYLDGQGVCQLCVDANLVQKTRETSFLQTV